MFELKKWDILTIGDTAVDAFIRLEEAEVRSNMNHDKLELCIAFGSKIPYESFTIVPGVGNSANASVSAKRLGLSSLIITNLGSDENGKLCMQLFKKEGVNTEYIKTQIGKNTSFHFVLWYGVERTILTKHNDMNYSLPALPKTKWVYLSSLGNAPDSYYEKILEFLKNNPDIKLAFQPGSLQIKMGAIKLREFYKRAEIFICNKEEAQIILKNSHEGDFKKLLWGIKSLGPKLVSITDGIKGSYAYDGQTYWSVPIYPNEPYERTGAGDAYSSAIVSALALGKSFEEALLWGPINSASVVSFIGAQKGLLTRKQIEKALSSAPNDYKLKII